MPGGVALNPDSAIPRSLSVCTDRAKVHVIHVNREQVGYRPLHRRRRAPIKGGVRRWLAPRLGGLTVKGAPSIAACAENCRATGNRPVLAMCGVRATCPSNQ